jgi:hypothetical protein
MIPLAAADVHGNRRPEPVDILNGNGLQSGKQHRPVSPHPLKSEPHKLSSDPGTIELGSGEWITHLARLGAFGGPPLECAGAPESGFADPTANGG